MTNPEKPSTQRERDMEMLFLVKQGDEDAFAHLFHSNKAKIYALCLRMTMDASEAEDLTQEAFLQAFRKIGSFRGDSSVSTWLYRVAMNTVLMHFRKKSVKQVLAEQSSTVSDEAAPVEFRSIDERLNQSVERIALTRALRELPKGYRNIFLMHQVKGYDHREIAKLMGCSIGNSKSQLNRAKARMRELLTPDAKPALVQDMAA